VSSRWSAIFVQGAQALSREERKNLIDKELELSVVRQCELLRVSRSNYYYQSAPVPHVDLQVMRVLDEIHLNRPFLGSRRLVDELKKSALKNRVRLAGSG